MNLKIRNWTVLLLTAIFAIATKAGAQRVVEVPQGFGTLNAVIDGDIMPNGERNDPNTIYLLERNGWYITTGTLENVGYKLTIMAKEGEGDRPIIKPAVDQGGLSVEPFMPRGDLHLKGLEVRNVDILGQVLLNTITGRSDSLHILIDDCHLDTTTQAFVRMDVDWLNIKIKNCILSNSFGAYSGSRVYDTRKNNVDTILIQNTTIYNVCAYPSRGTGSGGAINAIIWDHNTLFNISRKLGGVGQTVYSQFTNNLFINTAIMGRDSNGTFFPPYGQYPTDIFLDIEELNNIYAIGKTQILYFHHNNFFNDEPYATYPFPEGVAYPIPYFEDYGWQKYYEYNSKDNWFKEPIAFTKAPPVDTTFVSRLWHDTDKDMDGTLGTDIFAAFSDEGSPFDFSYPTDHVLYSAGSDGFPLGDLNWFPDKKAEWEGSASAVKSESKAIPGDFELLQNYPNPFNPVTTINYELQITNYVELIIYNSLGEKVATLIGQRQNPGKHHIQWDASGYASGIYIVRLMSGAQVQSKKILLVK